MKLKTINATKLCAVSSNSSNPVYYFYDTASRVNISPPETARRVIV